MSREEMLGLTLYRRGVCECGFHESLTADKRNHFGFEDKVCPVCQGVARAARMQTATDEKIVEAMGKDPAPRMVRPTDGRRTFVKMLSPAEVEAAKAERANPA